MTHTCICADLDHIWLIQHAAFPGGSVTLCSLKLAVKMLCALTIALQSTPVGQHATAPVSLGFTVSAQALYATCNCAQSAQLH